MSVASIFSRLYEQEYAFSILSDPQNVDPVLLGEAKKSVSRCLDLLELLLIHGSEIEVIQIGMYDIERFGINNHEGRQLLASMIREDLRNPSLSGIYDWYLFVWNDIVLGGVSPMTLVYTSPNVEMDLQKRGIEPVGFCGKLLFKEVVPLISRGKQFREFMYSYLASYNLPNPLRQYIESCRHMDNIPFQYNPMPSVYAPIKNGYGQPVALDQIPLFHIPVENKANDSGYLIIPNKMVTGALPIVLSAMVLPGSKYIFNMCWDHHILENHQYNWEQPLEDRILPGTNIRYPYISIDDLLENRIIRLNEEIDGNCFQTWTRANGRSEYLLPLKELFFKYFNVEDLNYLVEINTSGDEVEVWLQIPVRDGKIEFRRIYKEYDIVDLKFNVAITPMLKMPGETYHLLCSATNDTQLQIGNSENAICNVEVSYTERYQDSEYRVGCYSIQDAWDYIAVSSRLDYGNEYANGIIVPIFRQFIPSGADCTFNIDMGEDHTAIAHMMPHSFIELMSLHGDDHILGILCRNDEMLKLWMRRYFLCFPDSNCIKSPIKNRLNSTYEVKSDPQSGKWLENYNIALDYEDFPRRGECIIRPSVNNFLSFKEGENLRLYFEGLLYLMKQTAIRQYGTSTFNLCVIVPSYLNNAKRGACKDIWQRARQASGTEDGKETKFISSAAALATVTQQSYGIHGNIVNIHIGSHHTEICHCENNGTIRNLCVDMGIGALLENNSEIVLGDDRRFVGRLIHEYYMRKGYPDERMRRTEELIEHGNWSLVDIIEIDQEIGRDLWHFFDYGDLGRCIKESVTIFLCGILYYLGIYLKEFGLGQPDMVVISGLGRKYIESCFYDVKDVKQMVDSIWHGIGYCKNQRLKTSVAFQNQSLVEIHNSMTIVDPFPYTMVCSNGIIDTTKGEPAPKEINVKKEIFSAFRDFIDVLRSAEISEELLSDEIDTFERMARYSIEECVHQYMNASRADDMCDQPLFFWSLKHSLYQWLKYNCKKS